MNWVTSDQHMGHEAIVRYSNRPFMCARDMNEALVSNFNSVVSENDTTYHIGDFSMREKEVPIYLPRLHGSHILIFGNHDACHPCKKKWQQAAERYLDYGFKELHQELELDEFVLSHMPFYNEAAHDQRHKQYRPVRKSNKVLLHGHVHTSWRYRANPPQYNVGVDANHYFPISLDGIRAFLASNPEEQ